MRQSKRLIIVGCILMVVLGGLGVLFNYLNPYSAYANSDAIAAGIDRTVVAANTRFAIMLLKELQKAQSGKNIFISPLSVSIALSMTYNGANSTTKKAMRSVLGFGGMSDEAINVGFQQLISSLVNVDKDVNLNIGNSVWIKSAIASAVKSDFTNVLSRYYGSSIFIKPFDSSTVDEVNSWVKGETRGRISKLLDKIDPDNVMFLINAIYFNGSWANEFDAALTQKADFKVVDGSTVEVDMMRRNGRYLYYGDGQIQVARLPYGRDKIAMYIFLPAEDVPLESLVFSLSCDKLEAYLSGLSNTELELQMPRLKLEYGRVDLKDALTSLGMGIAFDSASADFSGIADVRPQRLYIAFVDHKAVIEVNEKGTEAAAATNVGVSLTSVPTIIPFTVNRPYMFIIRDDRSGTILFSGLITDPTVQSSP